MWLRVLGILFGVPQLNKHRNRILKHSVLRIWKVSVIPPLLIRLILR